MPYSLLSKNIKIKIYRTIILPLVLYGCKTWSLTLREECRLRVLENRVLIRIFGSMRDKVMGSRENYIMRSLMICTAHHRLFRWSNWEELDGMGHAARTREMCERFWWGNLRERCHLEDSSMKGNIVLSWFFRNGIVVHGQDRGRWRNLVNAVMNIWGP